MKKIFLCVFICMFLFAYAVEAKPAKPAKVVKSVKIEKQEVVEPKETPVVLERQEFYNLTYSGKVQEKLNSVGFRILNAGNIDKKAVFVYKNDAKVKAYTNAGLLKSREVVIHGGILTYCDTDDELAAILSREISYITDSYNGVMRGSFSPIVKISSLKKHEYKADKRAVDFMVDAGYNPLALIVVMNKIYGQYRYDFWGKSPLTSKRMVEVYEYIYKKYPYFLAENIYKDNIYYQNFLLTSAQNRVLLQKKIESEKIIKVNYK